MIIRTVVVLVALAGAPAMSAAQATRTSSGAYGNACSPVGQLTRVEGLREASGVTIGRIGTLWVHNDSGEPVLFALDETGTVAGRVRAAQRVDLTPLREPRGEGLALGPDGAVYLVGEGGGGSRSESFARLTCRYGDPG